MSDATGAAERRRRRERGYFESGRWTDEAVGWVSGLAAQRWGDRPYLLLDDVESLTYAEFHRWVVAVAADMVSHGVSRGDRVYVQLPNCLEAVVVQVAAFRIGAVAVPVVPIYREHEMRQILADAKPAVIAAPAVHRDRQPVEELDRLIAEAGLEVRARYIVGGSREGWQALPSREGDADESSLPDPAQADGLALILYTSGTTSAPKGAMFNSRALFASSRMWRFGLDLDAKDVIVACAPVAHLAGFMDAFLIPTAIGGKGLILSSWNPDANVRIIEKHRGSHSNGAPVFLLDLVERYERGEGAQHKLTFFMAGGAGVAPSLVQRADAIGVSSFRNYGMTETMGSVTLMSKQDSLERRGEWDGKPYEGMELEIIDEDRRVLAAGEVGQIRVRGPQLMLGYTDPVVTASQMDEEGWFYPGDLGFVDGEGWLKCVGRTKDIINRGGEKFPSQDIEEAIVSHPTIQLAAVAGLPDERLGERVAAFVTLRPGADWPGAEAMKVYLNDAKLSRQKIPVEWHVLSDMPRTASGKIRKNELVERAADLVAAL
jgi:acyl-CoA synthetase (AMP-forming)/AMP-acid ligase II